MATSKQIVFTDKRKERSIPKFWPEYKRVGHFMEDYKVSLVNQEMHKKGRSRSNSRAGARRRGNSVLPPLKKDGGPSTSGTKVVEACHRTQTPITTPSNEDWGIAEARQSDEQGRQKHVAGTSENVDTESVGKFTSVTENVPITGPREAQKTSEKSRTHSTSQKSRDEDHNGLKATLCEHNIEQPRGDEVPRSVNSEEDSESSDEDTGTETQDSDEIEVEGRRDRAKAPISASPSKSNVLLEGMDEEDFTTVG